jgi:hypothetical protein
MKLYRGTAAPESYPASRLFECVFFTPNFDYAAKFAQSSQTLKRVRDYSRKEGYVQEYYFPRKKLLDISNPRANELAGQYLNVVFPKVKKGMMLNAVSKLFWYPEAGWIQFLKDDGFDGYRVGDWDVCIFDVSKAVLMNCWKVWIKDGRGYYTEFWS